MDSIYHSPMRGGLLRFRSSQIHFLFLSSRATVSTTQVPIQPSSPPVWKSKFYGTFVLNLRVVLHAIDATPARWRGDAGSSSLRNDLVKNYRVHAMPSSRRRVDGVEDNATIQHERAVKF